MSAENCNVLIGPSSFGQLDDAPLKRLEGAGFAVVPNPFRRRYTAAETVQLLYEHRVGALVAGLEPLGRAVLEQAPGLKVISRCGSGMSNVDRDTARELGIAVRNTPDGPTASVAELTVANMLNSLRLIGPMNESLHAGKWDKRIGGLLGGRTVVLVGCGRIGRRVAELLKPFGSRIVFVDPLVDSVPEGTERMALDDALPEADVVSLHLAGETCVLDEAAFERLKPGAFVMNAARGASVSEQALIEALESGKVAGAWLDALPKEPYDGPLRNYARVTLTPHVASYTREGRLGMEMECIENLIEAWAEVGERHECSQVV